MADSNDTPTLARLALQYGTINSDQYRHITALYALRKREKEHPDYASLLLTQRFATRHQIGLLKLIREYHLIKKQGEAFGKIAIAKGYATEAEVNNAIEQQRNEFRRARIKKLIGDILVESRVITPEQKDQIIKEQTFPERNAKPVQHVENPEDTQPGKNRTDDAQLSEYEKQFLQVKVLDREFAASVIEKGLASEQDVTQARQVQEEEFEVRHQLRILGDIMVSLSFLTEDQKNIILKEQNRMDEPEAESPALKILPVVSEDRTEVRIKIEKNQAPVVTLKSIKEILASKGIIHGIYTDALLQCHLDLKHLEFVVAKAGHSESLKKKLGVETFLAEELTDKSEKRKGDFLVKQRNDISSYTGTDVFGKQIKQDCGAEFFYRPGSGTRISKDNTGIVAAKTGVPSLSVERKLYIHPIIHVLEDADLRYGALETYANLSVAGVLTGAYPVTAGSINAREIRGARIDAIGDVCSDVGITDSVIRTQGDVRARYLHNCRIETFGNVFIENEIIDSLILCSGRLNSENCRVITTDIYAKQGIALAGVGSERTRACIMAAGSERHILEQVEQVESRIQTVKRELASLREEKKEQENLSQKTFQKMVELKLFHDRAKKKKRLVVKEYQKAKNTDANKNAPNKKNVAALLKNFEARMEKAISSLKDLNVEKKKIDDKKSRIERKIVSLKPKIEKQIAAFRQDILSFYEWTQTSNGVPEITITGKAFQGTQLKGVFSSYMLDTDTDHFFAAEIQETETEKFQIKLSPVHTL